MADSSLFSRPFRRIRMALSDGHMDVSLSPAPSPETVHAGHTVWINGVQHDDRSTEPWSAGELRRLGGIPDDHDLLVENAAWQVWRADGVLHRALVHREGEDVKIAIDDKPVDLVVHCRFYSTPRFINGG